MARNSLDCVQPSLPAEFVLKCFAPVALLTMCLLSHWKAAGIEARRPISRGCTERTRLVAEAIALKARSNRTSARILPALHSIDQGLSVSGAVCGARAILRKCAEGKECFRIELGCDTSPCPTVAQAWVGFGRRARHRRRRLIPPEVSGVLQRNGSDVDVTQQGHNVRVLRAPYVTNDRTPQWVLIAPCCSKSRSSVKASLPPLQRSFERARFAWR